MKRTLFILAVLCSQLGWSQDQMFDICPLKVGEEIPEVMLTDIDGKPVALQEMIADKPTVLVFYRGAWCGYCIKHLAELNDAKAEIEQAGYQIFGITADQSEKLEESIDKSSAEIEVYSDAKLEAISAFGLDWKVDDTMYDKYKNSYQLDLEAWSGETHHSLPVPAIFVVKDGAIVFQYVNPNYRIRLKPETLLAVLKTL